MNSFTYTIRTLLALTLAVALAIIFWPKPDPNVTDPKWRETLGGNSEPLLNVPAVSLASHEDGLVIVTATNTGHTTLEYRGSSPSLISLYQEVRKCSVWEQDAWSVDGMCEGFYQIAPRESVKLEIEFWDEGKAVRMLGKFSEKGTNRSGLVVLATSDELD